MRWTIPMALAALAAAPVLASAQERAEPQPPTVTVSASATVTREPDRARVLIAVESMARTAQEAARENARKMERVVAAIRRAGIAENQIRTVSYNLQPEYDYRQDREPQRQLVGYRAINMVQVVVDEITRTGPVIDASIEAGANRVANLRFELRDPQSARLEALREATRKARTEAEAMAAALGMRLGAPVNVTSVGGYAPPPPMPVEAYQARAVAMEAPPPPIEPGELTIEASVSAVFRLEPAR